MKKLTTLIISVLLLLNLASCSGRGETGKSTSAETKPHSGSRSETTTTEPATTTPETTNPPETTLPETEEPEKYDFSDALFIGDSRTAGMYLYGRIDGARYFARTSMNVFNCFNDKPSETGTGDMTLEDYLKANQFGRIYILLGINEIGYSYGAIINGYTKVVDKLRTLQPDADIVIQSNMHVTKTKSDASPKTFNNGRIDELNRRLSQLADSKQMFYLSIEPAFDDPDGNLNPDYTRDGIHLNQDGCKVWREFLLGNWILTPPNGSDDKIENSDRETSGTTAPVTTTTKTEAPKTELPTTEPKETDPPATEPVTTESQVTEPDFGDFFDDALFIGDSRTVGLFLHGKINGATFFASDDANVFNLTKNFNSDDTKPAPELGDKSLSEVLKSRKFGKIYLLFGINELGGSTVNSVKRTFSQFITLLSAAQPEAKIIIQSNMHVTKTASDSDPDLCNNENIDSLNNALKSLANGKRVFYFGFESLFDGDDGCLKPEYAGTDGITLGGDEPYLIWRNYLAGQKL